MALTGLHMPHSMHSWWPLFRYVLVLNFEASTDYYQIKHRLREIYTRKVNGNHVRLPWDAQDQADIIDLRGSIVNTASRVAIINFHCLQAVKGLDEL